MDSQSREQHGFLRTVCGCDFCRAPCHHVPGALDPSDLERLCPPGQDLFAWAERHLRALTDKPFPTLVPARQANGHCAWLFDGMCAVHGAAPYGCAFFDAHMTDAEIERRYAATVRARQQDAAKEGMYVRLWRHLCRKGLIGRPADRAGLNREQLRLRRQGERNRRRLDSM